ncbi:cytokinin hydroxylase-like [Camellia sinensis]|uniref:cytokinin hydroxylase-like n=1 Tax=Camellia sinensis TaxID=4442 RepID=UPI0010357DA9|nr:cytokinin hydroxylase-like [Camellia sinensis]
MESEVLLLRDYATRQINALLWVSLIAITVLLLRKVIRIFRLWSIANLIPGPPCPSSFYGHSTLISGPNLTDLLSKSHEEYGPVVKLWLGPTQLLVSIKDPELIKEMLLKAKDKLPLTGRAFHLAFGRSSLFVSSFKEVQKRRDLLATELNGKLLQRANLIPTKVVDCVMERIQDIMSKGSLDCKMVSQHLACTVLGATLFGDAFLGWSEATIYEELLMMIAKDACFWASYSVTPIWNQGFWRYQYLCTKLKSLTQDIIQQCRQNYKLFCQMDQNPHHETRNTVGGAASAASHSANVVTPDNIFLQEFDDHVNAREPCGNIMSVMFHGYLTTAGLIGNVLARLATNPEIQDKIHSEIIMVRKGSLGQDQQSVKQMLFLLATLYESARLLPAGPLLQRCSLKHDFNLKTGVMIPAGAILVVPVQLVQMDDSSWGSDANQFNPYRFLSKAEKKSNIVNVMPFAEERVDVGQGTYVLNDPNENAAFLPFGSGTRACLGQKFVILGVATLFASLLEHYEIRLQPGSENDPKPMMNQLLPNPKIVFVKRDS